MTFTPINLSKPKPYRTPSGFTKNPKSQELFLRTKITEKQNEMSSRQQKIMELYAYHMRLIAEEQEMQQKYMVDE